VDLTIEALAARPEHLPTVAQWIYGQWWSQVPGASVGTLCAMLREGLTLAPVPLTLLATSGQHPVGTVSVLAHDVGTEPWAAMSPWLAALYVIPTARRRGVGAALIEAALARAAAFAAGSVYLLTTDQEAYYARLGWKIVTRGDDAVVMARVLARTS
jgi:predicted N-acetyltransferase YhbS